MSVFSWCLDHSPVKEGVCSWAQLSSAAAEMQGSVVIRPRPLSKPVGSPRPDPRSQGPLAGLGVPSLAYLQPQGPPSLRSPLLLRPHRPGSSCLSGEALPLRPGAGLVSLPAASWWDEGCISEQ